MNWLHTMQQDDPVAERAHRVMRRILQNVTPALQEKAAELLIEGQASKSINEQSFKPPVATQNFHNDPSWAHGEFNDRTGSFTGRQHFPQDLQQHFQDTTQYSTQDFSMYGSNHIENAHMSGTFGHPFTNAWDQGMPLTGLDYAWYNPDFCSANVPEDMSGMQLFSGTNIEEQPYQALQRQQKQQGQGQG